MASFCACKSRTKTNGEVGDLISMIVRQSLQLAAFLPGAWKRFSQMMEERKKEQTTMVTRMNSYNDLLADYSKPQPVSADLGRTLLHNAEQYLLLRENLLPEINSSYNLAQIEQENKEWWPTHCEALRQGRGDLLTGEYADELVYFCADGPFYGRTAGTQREANWWAILAQPGVTMVWPIVLFHGEVVYFEWQCLDDQTHETIAKGNVTWLRRGHRGGCYLKCEQLTFYRDVYAPPELLASIAH